MKMEGETRPNRDLKYNASMLLGYTATMIDILKYFDKFIVADSLDEEIRAIRFLIKRATESLKDAIEYLKILLDTEVILGTPATMISEPEALETYFKLLNVTENGIDLILENMYMYIAPKNNNRAMYKFLASLEKAREDIELALTIMSRCNLVSWDAVFYGGELDKA
jgi:tetratricopeptide (TPR) repeat protein